MTYEEWQAVYEDVTADLVGLMGIGPGVDWLMENATAQHPRDNYRIVDEKVEQLASEV